MPVRTCLALVPAVLLFSIAASAQCTKDTDCKFDRICVSGECVTYQEHDSGPGASGAADQKRAACTQKCEHARSKCFSKAGEADDQRKICLADHERCLSDCGVSW